jgi:hypothetical protein
MFAVWPIDDLFTFFYWFAAGVAFAGETGCYLSWIARKLCIISHFSMVLG